MTRLMVFLRPLSYTLIVLCLPACGLYWYTPEEASLCHTIDQKGWEYGAGGWEYTIIDNRYSFAVLDDGSRTHVSGPVRNVYWVMISAGDWDLRKRSIASGTMVYDPGSAVITIHGQQLHALPRLWLAESKEGPYAPTTEIPATANLNLYAHRAVNWFYIAFPMQPPSADDTWKIDPGTITLDGMRKALPVSESCHRDGYWKRDHII